MQVKIEHRYLVFPVNHRSTEKILWGKVDGKVTFAQTIMLDDAHPDFYAYLEVTPLLGQTVDFTTEPEMTFNPPRQTDEIDLPNLYGEYLRPLAHFSVKSGWNNDPNGMIYANGTYHMFYQYNPAGTVWGTMYWGHAISTDMYHWEECPIALYPDDHGTIFSGSAIVDKDNKLGLKTGDDDVILLYYTAAGNPTTQRLAYTADNGKTFHKYGEVLAQLIPGNRDPKVIYCEERGDYVMALYLDSDRFGIFASSDLMHWEQIQDLSIPEDNECPDFFPLTVDGVRKWVFIGAHARYLVGDIRDGKFVPTQEKRRLQSEEIGYAAQTYSNIPGKVVRVLWDRIGAQGMPFSQQMGFPHELALEKDGDEFMMVARPVDCAPLKGEPQTAVTGEGECRLPLNDAPYRLRLKAPKDAKGKLHLSLCGRRMEIDLDAHNFRYTYVSCPTGEGLTMDAIIDRCSMEIFFDRGQHTCRVNVPVDRNLPYLSLSGVPGVEVSLQEWEPMR